MSNHAHHERRTKNFLFICTGNICRSVMAEYLLNKLAADRGLHLKAKSCGVAAERFYQVPPAIHSVLAAEGVAKVSHVSQIVTRDLLRWADIVFGLTRAHKEIVLDHYPEFTSKVHVLRTYAGLSPADVSDPIGHPEPVYKDCLERIRDALAVILNNESAQIPRP